VLVVIKSGEVFIECVAIINVVVVVCVSMTVVMIIVNFDVLLF